MQPSLLTSKYHPSMLISKFCPSAALPVLSSHFQPNALYLFHFLVLYLFSNLPLTGGWAETAWEPSMLKISKSPPPSNECSVSHYPTLLSSFPVFKLQLSNVTTLHHTAVQAWFSYSYTQLLMLHKIKTDRKLSNSAMFILLHAN